MFQRVRSPQSNQLRTVGFLNTLSFSLTMNRILKEQIARPHAVAHGRAMQSCLLLSLL
jgi:hypothetical protein